MARPLYDREKIISRQDNIEVLMKPENMDFVAKSSALLKKVYDMPKLILRIKKVAATQKEWCKLLGAMAAALLIFEEMSHFYNSTVNSMDKRFALEFLASADVEVVRNTYSTLHEAVDISSSISAGELVIMSGFSKELDEITLLYDNLERCLTDAARRILHAFPLLNHIAVEYVPQIGYLAVIDMADSNLVYADEFKLIYELNEKGYYKCSACFQLDDEIGDIKGTLNDTRKKIFLALEEVLIEAESSIVDMSLSIGALDAIISLTKVAVEMKFSRPEIVQDSVIIIKNGLHPLVQLAVDAYVPNDTYMTPEMNIALITG